MSQLVMQWRDLGLGFRQPHGCQGPQTVQEGTGHADELVTVQAGGDAP